MGRNSTIDRRVKYVVVGIAIGVAATLATQLFFRLSELVTWSAKAEITFDTIAAWLGVVTSGAIAGIGLFVGSRVSKHQIRVDQEKALTIALEFQLRVRVLRGENEYLNRWAVHLYVKKGQPVSDLQLLVDDKVVHSQDVFWLTRDSPYVWKCPQPLENMPRTRDEIEANRYIRSHVRQRVKVDFTAFGYRFRRTAGGIEKLGAAPRAF